MVRLLPNQQKVAGFGLVNLGANLDNSVKHCCCYCFHSIDIGFLRQYVKMVNLLMQEKTYKCMYMVLPFMDSASKESSLFFLRLRHTIISTIINSPAPANTPIMIAVFILFPPPPPPLLVPLPPPLVVPPPPEGGLFEREPPLSPDGEDLPPPLSPPLEGGEPRDGGDSLPPAFPPPPCDAGGGGELLLESGGEGACGAGGVVESGGGGDEPP